jgi:hypothetical protein
MAMGATEHQNLPAETRHLDDVVGDVQKKTVREKTLDLQDDLLARPLVDVQGGKDWRFGADQRRRNVVPGDLHGPVSLFVSECAAGVKMTRRDRIAVDREGGL